MQRQTPCGRLARTLHPTYNLSHTFKQATALTDHLYMPAHTILRKKSDSSQTHATDIVQNQETRTLTHNRAHAKSTVHIRRLYHIGGSNCGAFCVFSRCGLRMMVAV